MQIQATLKHTTRRVWSTIERAVRARPGALAVACVVLLSLAFRLHVSRACSMWLDEVATHFDALRPWPRVLHGPEQEHPPLMFVLVKIATYVLGTSETAVRSVSIFFGCLSPRRCVRALPGARGHGVALRDRRLDTGDESVLHQARYRGASIRDSRRVLHASHDVRAAPAARAAANARSGRAYAQRGRCCRHALLRARLCASFARQ